MKKLILTILALFLVLSTGWSQQFPITVFPQVNPPAPVYFHNYADASTLNSPLRVQLLLNDLTVVNEQIRLKLYFEGNGISFQSRDFVVGAEPLFIDGGTPLVLSNLDLAPYFEMQNIQGINPNVYGSVIPEGSYQFCFEVYDFTTGNRFSSKTCVSTYIFKNEPPLLNLPLNKTNIEPSEVENIVFQWTPRHINVSNVEYELSIVEVWDDSVDPQTAFFSSIPVFETTTRATSFIYGPSQPLLLSGKRYAWRIRAKALQGAEEIGLFRNEGKSEVYWFSRTSPCEVPSNIYAEAKGKNKINIFWEENQSLYREYTIAYREANKTDAEWFTVRTNSSWATIWHLKPGTIYEYKVSGTCKFQESIFSEIQEVATATEDDAAADYNCGIVPDNIAIRNQKPHLGLRVGDGITAGDFVVILTEISSQHNGVISGKGFVKIPYLNYARLAVNYNEVLINTNSELAQGEIVTVYDADFGEGAEMTVDVEIHPIKTFTGDQGEITTAIVDFDIETIERDENGAWVITGTNGEQGLIPGGDDIAITDNNGDTYRISEDGIITKGEVAPGGQVTAGNTNGVDADGVSEIQDIGVKIEFITSGLYAYDKKPDIENASLASEYPTVTVGGKEQPIVFKAISDLNGDDIIKAKVTFEDNAYTKEDVVFKTKEGSLVSASWNKEGNEATLRLVQVFDYGIEDIVATVPVKDDSSKQHIIGTFKLVHLGAELSNINLVIVPINNERIENGFERKINEIYNKAGVNFNTKIAPTLEVPQHIWDSNRNGFLNVGDNSTDEENNIIQYFKTQPGYETDTYYMFISDLPVSDSKIDGFMALKEQFGFVFNTQNQAKIAAHELGHGVFGLEHPFKAYGTAEGATGFLMDYNEGTNLSHMDWKKMHAPGFELYWFKKEEDGAYTDTEFTDKIFQIIRCAYLNTNKNDLISFDTSVFGKTGTFNSTWKGDEIWIKINNGNFEGRPAYEPVEIGKDDKENQPWRYSLLYKNVEIYTPGHSTGSEPTALQTLRKYLFPEDTSQFKKEAEEILAEIHPKDEFEDVDFEKIKSIANCGIQYFTAEQRYQIIAKIVKSTNITEYYEDLILDLFETAPLEDSTAYYDELLGYLLDKDDDVLKELFADIDDAKLGTLWKGREDNYTRFINTLADFTVKLDSDKKWKIINYIINNDYGDLENVEKTSIATILKSMDENSTIADKVPAISELFLNMLDEDDSCEALENYKIVFDIATLRHSNVELFASFTQSETTVLLDNKETIIRGIEKQKMSWVYPNVLTVIEFGGDERELEKSDLKNLYVWYKYLDENKETKDLLKTNPSEYFRAFLDQLSKHLESVSGTNNEFWKAITSIDCANRETIVEHINANENSESLKKVTEDLRLELLEKMFECNWFGVSDTDAFYKNTEDVLTKLVSSFDSSDTSILVALENIGLDNVYKKLSGERLSKFLAWTGTQIINSGHIVEIEESNALEILKADGTFITKDELLKLESNLFSFQNFSGKISNKTKITTDLGNIDYNQMVLVYVEGSFTFLDKKYKKGEILYMPLIQAFAMSNSNSNIAFSKGAWFAVDAASLAVGIGSVGVLIKVGGTVKKVIVASDLLGSTSGMLANALNDDAISEDMRFKLNMLALAASLPQIATSIKKFDNIITELDDQIDEARGLNAASREVLEDHLEKITEKLGTKALKGAKEISPNSYKELSKAIQYRYDDPDGKFLDISLEEIHEDVQKLIKESELPDFVKIELAEAENYKALSSLINNHSEKLFNMVSSSNTELVDYAMFLIRGRKEEHFDLKTYEYLVEEAEKVFKLTSVKAIHRVNDGGFRGAFLDGELNGDPVVYKYDLNHTKDAINEMEKILIDLKPYGGPAYYGRNRVQLEDGTWREVVAMEHITGQNLKIISASDDIGSIKVTDIHLKAIDDIESKLRNDKMMFVEDINLGDFILTNDPKRPIVMIDMLLKGGQSQHQGLIASGTNKPIRSTIEELIEAQKKTTVPTANPIRYAFEDNGYNYIRTNRLFADDMVFTHYLQKGEDGELERMGGSTFNEVTKTLSNVFEIPYDLREQGISKAIYAKLFEDLDITEIQSAFVKGIGSVNYSEFMNAYNILKKSKIEAVLSTPSGKVLSKDWTPNDISVEKLVINISWLKKTTSTATATKYRFQERGYIYESKSLVQSDGSKRIGYLLKKEGEIDREFGSSILTPDGVLEDNILIVPDQLQGQQISKAVYDDLLKEDIKIIKGEYPSDPSASDNYDAFMKIYDSNKDNLIEAVLGTPEGKVLGDKWIPTEIKVSEREVTLKWVKRAEYTIDFRISQLIEKIKKARPDCK